EFALEVLLQQGARHADIVGDLVGLDAEAGVLADVVQRAHDMLVVHRFVPAAGLHVDALGRHDDALLGQPSAVQHLVQQPGGGMTHFLGALDHRRQRDAFNDTPTTEIYTLSLHDALPILPAANGTSDRNSATIILPTSGWYFSFVE